MINFDLVGNLIVELRDKCGLSQKEFAEEMGVSKGAVCQWEQGSGIKTENLYDIAKYFNITVSELINGQLNEEDDDYFERNYNLDDFEFFDEINESNYNQLLEYLKRCKNVIKRFMTLYQLKEDNKLTNKQNNEYLRLSQYFKLDHEYLADIQMSVRIYSIDGASEELNKVFEFKNRSELNYMLYKLFNLDIKINPVALLSYEDGEYAANEYLELIGAEYCDELLTKLVSEMTDDEIEQSLPVKRLIEFGARCFFTRKHIQSFAYNVMDEDVFKQLKGTAKNIIVQDRYEFFKKEEKPDYSFKFNDAYSWKNYSKDGYEYLIDFDATNRVRDIVLLKDKDPKVYYKNLVERSAKCLGAK